MSVPADIANQALDAAGVDFTLGDLQEGTRPAQVLLRAYGQCLRQLLRAAHWDFARKTAPLLLLADASGGTANVGTNVPVPWLYEYEYPIDCMKARFIPWNPAQQVPAVPTGNIAINTSTPQMGGLAQPYLSGQRIVPARFVIASDPNYPSAAGGPDWQVQGVSPIGRTVILTNVMNASLVYTFLATYPSLWDPLFRSAFVAYLASEVALPLAKDKKFGLAVRGQQIAIVKQKLTEARLADGNEGTYSSDISVDWMRARQSGAGWSGPWNGLNAGGPGAGGFGGYGWDSLSFGDGSAY